VQEAIERFLTWIHEDQGYTENTLNAYRGDLTQLLDFCWERHLQKWADVREEYVTAYLNHLERRAYARATVARKFAAARSFFQFLTREKIIPVDPTAGLGSVRVRKREPQRLSSKDVERLLQEAEQGRQAPRDRALLALLTAGLSASEAISLNLEDVELNRGRAFVRGRRGQERMVELAPTAIEALKRYLVKGRPDPAEEEEEAFFLNYRGQRLTRQGLWLVVKGWAEAAGVEGEISPRLLRHSAKQYRSRPGVVRSQIGVSGQG
jgi:integrase/recombinase XerD